MGADLFDSDCWMANSKHEPKNHMSNICETPNIVHLLYIFNIFNARTYLCLT